MASSQGCRRHGNAYQIVAEGSRTPAFDRVASLRSIEGPTCPGPVPFWSRAGPASVWFSPGLVPLLARFSPVVVTESSRLCPRSTRRRVQHPICTRPKRAQAHVASGSRSRRRFRCQTKENNPPQGKPKKIKGMTAPGGCVVCGGFKGPAAALAAGALKPPVSVRGTLTKSEGRPRRRSRWDWTPRSKTPFIQSKGPPLGRPFCFGGCCGG